MTKKFNYLFNDNEFNEEVSTIPLAMPAMILRSKGLSFWIQKSVVFDETFIIDKDTTKEINYHLKEPKIITNIVRPPDYKFLKNFIVKDVKTNEPTDREMPKELYEIMFPPRSWMSNNINETNQMYNAAKVAKGNVLVGGLGLGIYPQYIFALNRPVDSITIVDSDKDIIDVVGKVMLDNFKDKKIKIVCDTIENFMQNTSEKFDTVYLDTWGDLNFKFLFYINYLISLADKITTETGIIGAWGYRHMYMDFLDTVDVIHDAPEVWDNFYNTENNVMIKYLAKRKEKPELEKSEYIKFAKDMVLNTIDSTTIDLTMQLSTSPSINRRLS